MLGEIQIANALTSIHHTVQRLSNNRLLHFLPVDVAYLKIMYFNQVGILARRLLISPVKLTTMLICIACITRQPTRSSARAGGISA